MSANLRDNFRGTIIKFLCLGFLILFFVVGLIKNLLYGSSSIYRTDSPAASGNLLGVKVIK